MNRALVIFDVDNTIVRGQSQNLFLGYLYRKKIVGAVFFLRMGFWFMLYKFHLVADPKRAMEYAYGFLAGREAAPLEAIAHEYLRTYKDRIIYKEIFPIVEEHCRAGREMILVSNSPDIIVREIGKMLGIEQFISTRLEVKDGIFTGRMLSDIVYGVNKLHNVREFEEKTGGMRQETWSYGDHISDLPLLEATTHPFAVNPDRYLRKEAQKRGWTILDFA